MDNKLQSVVEYYDNVFNRLISEPKQSEENDTPKKITITSNSFFMFPMTTDTTIIPFHQEIFPNTYLVDGRYIYNIRTKNILHDFGVDGAKQLENYTFDCCRNFYFYVRPYLYYLTFRKVHVTKRSLLLKKYIYLNKKFSCTECTEFILSYNSSYFITRINNNIIFHSYVDEYENYITGGKKYTVMNTVVFKKIDKISKLDVAKLKLIEIDATNILNIDNVGANSSGNKIKCAWTEINVKNIYVPSLYENRILLLMDKTDYIFYDIELDTILKKIPFMSDQNSIICENGSNFIRIAPVITNVDDIFFVIHENGLSEVLIMDTLPVNEGNDNCTMENEIGYGELILTVEEEKDTHIIKQETQDNECVVCYNYTTRKNAIVPCGHTQYCSDCIKNVTRDKKCYICREPVQGIVSIY